MAARRTDPEAGRSALASWATAPERAGRAVLAPAVRHTLEMFAEDGFHPSRALHAAFADAVMEQLELPPG